jgi:hypothetical protein
VPSPWAAGSATTTIAPSTSAMRIYFLRDEVFCQVSET